jgi:hypothetical protein
MDSPNLFIELNSISFGDDNNFAHLFFSWHSPETKECLYNATINIPVSADIKNTDEIKTYAMQKAIEILLTVKGIKIEQSPV